MNGPYLAHAETKVVHDLNNLKPECKITEITSKLKQYFDPDQTIDEIKALGFLECKHCIK